MAPAQDRVGVRRFELEDIAPALRIERASFATPWSEAMFVLEVSKASSACLAAEIDDELVGYLCASRYASIWHVMNVSVDPDRRRHGVASALLCELMRLTAGEQPAHYTLEVRVSNTAAIAMYRSNGFRSAGVRPGYYADNREDALIMWHSTDPGFVPPNVADPSEWAQPGGGRSHA